MQPTTNNDPDSCFNSVEAMERAYEDRELQDAEKDVANNRIAFGSFKRSWKVALRRLSHDVKHGASTDKRVICAVVARKAAITVARRLRLIDFSLELQAVGFEHAIKKWNSYDPSKDTGPGRQAYLYGSAKGAIYNAAKQMLNRNNKRKTEFIDSYDPIIADKKALGHSGVTKPAPNITDLDEKEVSYNRVQGNAFNWTTRVRDPGRSGPYSDLGRVNAAETQVFDILSKLDRPDRELLMAHWGVVGKEKESITAMAEQRGLTYSTMRREIEALNLRIGVKPKPKKEKVVTMSKMLDIPSSKNNESLKRHSHEPGNGSLFVRGARVSNTTGGAS